MSSILILDIEPGDCGKCKIHLHNAGVCACSHQFGNSGCPLRHVSVIEEKVRPMSKEKFTKYYVEDEDLGGETVHIRPEHHPKREESKDGNGEEGHDQQSGI